MGRMIRRTTLPILSVLAALAAVLAFASSAQADRELRIVGKPATKAQIAAAAVRCERGEFCGWRHAGYHGGLFHYDGDDTNLFNDKFEIKDTNVTVAKQITAVFNNGYDVAGADDVVAITTKGRWCIPNYYLSSNIGKWNDTITGYYWTDCDGN
jgi:peptidase inhibitor family I36